MPNSVVRNAKAKGNSVEISGNVMDAEKSSTSANHKASKDMGIIVPNLVGQLRIAPEHFTHVSYANHKSIGRLSRLKMDGLAFAQENVEHQQFAGLEAEETTSSLGSAENGLRKNVLSAVVQKNCNSTTSFLNLLAERQSMKMLKPFAKSTIYKNTGRKTCHTTHGLNNITQDVDKFSLIDLEIPTGTTGRKRKHRERLSERTPETVMRQSEPTGNVIKNCGREIRSGFPASFEVTKVTECMYYSGGEVLNIAAADVLSAAEFDWKQAAVAVTITGLEADVQNVGKAQVIDLLEGRITNAQRTMKNQVTVGMYSDGTGSGGKQIGGLQLLVADDPTTGTVGGINRANFSFWQNKLLDASVAGAATSATNIQGYWNTLWLRTSRGADHTDLILADSVYYSFFWSSLQAIQRIYDPAMGQLGFNSVKFNTADVVYEDSTGIPASHAYFLNTDYIFLRYAARRLFKPLEKVQSINQDAMVQLITFAGNMTTSNSSLQGVHHE